MRTWRQSASRAIAAAACLPLLAAAILASAPGTASAASIQLTAPATNQIVQRVDDGTGSILVRGLVHGSRGAVEARWAGGPWLLVDQRIDDGRFSGVLSGLPAGQGALEVRLAADHSVRDRRDSVGIGDIFVVAGQSNACGRAPTSQQWTSRTFSAGMFANDCRWKPLSDPFDDPAGQTDAVSRDRPVRSGGSVWPLVATSVMAGAKVPVAFIPVPYSGSSIADWQCREDWPDDPGTLCGNMLRRVAKAGGAVRAVLFWQGEWDAGSGATTGQTYATQLRSLAVAVQRDLGAPFVVCQIGEIRWRQDTPPRAPMLDGIRMAQRESWGWSGLVAPGPALYDILLHSTTEDRVHYRTGRQLRLVARRWWCAIDAACYGHGDGRGPRLSEATYESADSSVVLAFTDDALPLIVPSEGGAFTVQDDEGAIAVTGVTPVGTDSLRLALSRPAVGSVTVSLGEGHTGAVNPVPYESGRWRLPAETFVAQPVVRD